MKYVSNEKRIFQDIQQVDISDCLNYLNKIDEIGVDTETEGEDPYTHNPLSIQLGDYEEQFVIDLSTINIEEFRQILEDNHKTFIFQNAQFDLRFLYHKNIYPENIYDTFLIETIISGGYGNPGDKKEIREISSKRTSEKFVDRSLALDKLAKKYCNANLDKSIRGNIHREGLSERVIRYAGDDVKYLSEIKKKQLNIIEDYKNKYKIDGKVVDLENEVVKVFSRMVYNGIIIDDKKYREKVLKTVEKGVNDAIHKLDNEVHNDSRLKKFTSYQMSLFDKGNERKTNINWKSYEQKMKVLSLIYPNISNTSSPTLRKQEYHPIKDALLEFNQNTKLKDAFGENFLKTVNNKTNKIHPNIWQNLATGRISMKNPNLLQVPAKGDLGKEIRSCFIPKEGYKMVGGDYSSFELSIIAEYSQDPLWVDTLNAGENLHTKLCSETFGISKDKVREPFPYNTDVTYRDVQKTLDFGLSYGMSGFKLSNTINVSKEKAEEIIDGFFSKVPKVRKFLEKLGKFGKNRGYVRIPNPYGRVRFFPKWDYLNMYETDKEFKWLGEVERAGKNTPIQGINATVIKIALIKAQKAIDRKNLPADLLLSIYDEIQSQVRSDISEKWRDILQQEMITAGKVFIKTVPVECDVEINNYWKK